MALPLGGRQIDDADRAAEPHGVQGFAAAWLIIADTRNSGLSTSWNSSSTLPFSAGLTNLRSAIPPHSLAAVTVPEYVVNPINRESSPYCSRTNCPSVSCPSAPTSVARASPT